MLLSPSTSGLRNTLYAHSIAFWIVAEYLQSDGISSIYKPNICSTAFECGEAVNENDLMWATVGLMSAGLDTVSILLPTDNIIQSTDSDIYVF
jgi:hypothetical protein